MKNNFSTRPTMLALLLATPFASLQAGPEGNAGFFRRIDDGDDLLNRFSVNYTMGLNIKAGFKNVSLVPNYVTVPNQLGVPTATQVNPGSASAQSSHVYDDGYNQVDASVNALGYTSYWGYQSGSQIQSDSIVMNATTANLGAGPQNLDTDPQHGFGLTYNRQLGRHGQLRWGVEASFGFTDVSIRENQTVAGSYTTTSDSYLLPPVPGGGVVSPPPPPYSGPYSSPPGSPLVGDAPTRTTVPVASTDQFNLDASVFSWRLGPYLQVPMLKQRVALSLSGGLAVRYVNSRFSFVETVPRPGLADMQTSSSGSNNDLLVGGYVSGDLAVRLTRSVDVSVGVQYIKTDSSFNTQGGKQAQINFGNSLFLSVGLGYRF